MQISQKATLAAIYFPEHTVNIGDNVFENCGNLTDIYFEWENGDRKSILFGSGVFDGCGRYRRAYAKRRLYSRQYYPHPYLKS